MRNRHGTEYWFEKVSDKKYRFHMDPESKLHFMRMGGREGQDELDMDDLGFFDPVGGPFISVGDKLYWSDIKDATDQDPLPINRIRSNEANIFVEVE